MVWQASSSSCEVCYFALGLHVGFCWQRGRMAVVKAGRRHVVFLGIRRTRRTKPQQRNLRKISVLPYLYFSANFRILEGVGGSNSL